jgi:PPM family protein phosphatase
MKSPSLQYAGISVTGHRASNQDDFCTIQVNDRLFFAAVADGMGGYSGGEIASKLAIDTAVDFIETYQDEITSTENLPDFLQMLYEQVNHAFERYIKAKPELAAMGTTLTCMLILDNHYVVGNIGDSRLYKINPKDDDLITSDHTLLSQMEIAPEKSDHLAHVLTKAIGRTAEDPDIFPGNKSTFTLNNGDAFLICSDGLILNKTAQYKHQFSKLIQKNDSFESILNNLINRAIEDGAKDNITAVVIKTQYGGLQRKTKRTIITVLAIIMFTIAATAALLLYKDESAAFYHEWISPSMEWVKAKIHSLLKLIIDK